MSRRLEDLEPDTQDRFREFLEHARREGIPIELTSTLRTHAEQAALWAQGRDTPGPIVTHAAPYHSWHEAARAGDVVGLILVTLPVHVTYDLPWERLAAIAARFGLEWGGHFAGLGDRDHFQYTGGLTLAEAIAQQDARLPGLA